MTWQAPDISTAGQRALAYGAGPETRLSWQITPTPAILENALTRARS
jgi:hypothetical protein